MSTKTKLHSKKLGLLLIGTFIFAIGINFFAIPAMLSEGGVIGISIAAYYYFDWSVAWVNFCLNAIVFVWGYRELERSAMVYTGIGVLFSTIFLHFTEGMIDPITEDTLLAAIFAGIFIGAGIGIVFLTGGTTGGLAIVARILKKKYDMKLGQSILYMDIVVIVISIYAIGLENIMYTFVAVFIGAKVVDFIVEGFNTKAALTIISRKTDEILEEVKHKINRGATILHGTGSYSGEAKDVIYVVISKSELLNFKRMLHEKDPEAFVVIHEVHEVLGEGFTIKLRSYV
ncbi:MAG: YitT family protein [Cyclobacteriaceae bacterium]|nr:YitT family protein [Cyclobacteriaceae bacterium]MCH8516379.1 YitT family protein [Cyclobacteriaceae bacterium]